LTQNDLGLPPQDLKRPPVAAVVKGRRIGLLGGSFNPAHEGHRHISLHALHRLRLDEVWWLVSPQNPLKSAAETASLAKRMERAAMVAAHPRIRVLDLESRLGTQYTIDSLHALRRRYPATRFVWLMGADNWEGFHRWRAWREILHTVPVAILDRPRYSVRSLATKAAQCFRRSRVAERDAWKLPQMTTPAWAFLHIPLHPQSATELRARNRNWLNT